MTPDAEWTLWVGPEDNLRRGHEAISAEIDREAPMMEFLHCGIRSIASNGTTVFTERTDKFVCMGKPVAFDLVSGQFRFRRRRPDIGMARILRLRGRRQINGNGTRADQRTVTPHFGGED